VYGFIKFILFLFPPERAHHITMLLLQFTTNLPGIRWFFDWYSNQEQAQSVEVAGITFKNRVGLAAGFDKNGKYIRALAALGFGHIEVGTVTPLPQDGNDKPRLFRLPKDSALINRMGFNNDGVKVLRARLEREREFCRRRKITIGANIGKNKLTPNEDAASDYLLCFNELYDVADYFVVNVSSPNTPNLRALQDKEPLTALLSALQGENKNKPAPKPIFLKIAPDLGREQLEEIAEIVRETKLAGVVATNTTISRAGLVTDTSEIEQIGAGGLSGAPVRVKSNEVLAVLRTLLPEHVAIIGVGGIDSVQIAQEKLDAGAQLVQVYTGFIYAGPSLIREINRELRKGV
jgi:dihydroorotate dehydrogenase